MPPGLLDFCLRSGCLSFPRASHLGLSHRIASAVQLCSRLLARKEPVYCHGQIRSGTSAKPQQISLPSTSLRTLGLSSPFAASEFSLGQNGSLFKQVLDSPQNYGQFVRGEDKRLEAARVVFTHLPE